MSVPLEPGLKSAVLFPRSVGEALSILEANPGETRVLAGATWLMRAASRGEPLPAVMVSLRQVAGADTIVRVDNGWRIGPMVTHDHLAEYCSKAASLGALGRAAGDSANPAVRRLATIGGNLAAADFAAADLVPALLALDARIEVADGHGTEHVPLEDFLVQRTSRTAPFVIAGIEISESPNVSAHARLTMRKAGDYPVATLSVSAELSDPCRIGDLRVAVGSVETTARRWRELEEALVGQPLDLSEIEAAAKAHLQSLTPRGDSDAPAWYRLEVVPSLVRAAFHDIAEQRKG